MASSATFSTKGTVGSVVLGLLMLRPDAVPRKKVSTKQQECLLCRRLAVGRRTLCRWLTLKAWCLDFLWLVRHCLSEGGSLALGIWSFRPLRLMDIESGWDTSLT